MSLVFQCTYCSRIFEDATKMNVHKPDCKRKNSDNPLPRSCQNCGSDYTRKSGSAYRAHIKKCTSKLMIEEAKSESAIKQADRRKQVLVSANCKHCSNDFTNITVGQFGDHQYKCKKDKPN